MNPVDEPYYIYIMKDDSKNPFICDCQKHFLLIQFNLGENLNESRPAYLSKFILY